MSISVDDLVSSLSSSHIGQEALDLAALQAQLAQTLFGQPISSSSEGQEIPQGSSYAQPCNTPTGRTPSASFSFGQVVDAQRYSSPASRRIIDEPGRDNDEMEEDERMVEDLLLPSSPMSANTSVPHFASSQQYITSPTKSHPNVYSAYPSATPSSAYFTEPSASLFTSTDPFYQQAAQNHNPPPSSLFSQSGRPAQQSPFLIQQHQQQNYQFQPWRENHGCIPSAPAPLAIDTHSLFVTASAAFER